MLRVAPSVSVSGVGASVVLALDARLLAPLPLDERDEPLRLPDFSPRPLFSGAALPPFAALVEPALAGFGVTICTIDCVRRTSPQSDRK